MMFGCPQVQTRKLSETMRVCVCDLLSLGACVTVGSISTGQDRCVGGGGGRD